MLNVTAKAAESLCQAAIQALESVEIAMVTGTWFVLGLESASRV